MPILPLSLILLVILVLAIPASAAEPEDVPWVIGPSHWAMSEGDSTRTYTTEVNRDWSGYRAVELAVSGGEGIVSVTLTDAAGLDWSAKATLIGKPVRIRFADFHAAGQGKAALDLAMLKQARIEIPRSATLAKIALSDSKGLYGPGVNMDIAFAYYRSKPWAEIVQDAKDEGFTCIHLVDVDLQPEGYEDLAKKAQAVRDAGLAAVLVIYPTTDHVTYDKHPEWRQKSLNGSSRFDWRTYLCPNNEEFVRYLEQKLTKVFSMCPLDGLELAEPWFEIWGGPEEPNVGGYYSCVCIACRKKFKDAQGVDPLDLFNREGIHYFRRNPELYEKWVRFRVDTLESMMNRVFAAARKSRPEIATITMQVSDCRVEPGKAREYQGQDFDSMITRVKPDALIIESAWQDWAQSRLEPVYIADYEKAYVPRRGKVKLLSQCDIGSSKDAKRGLDWLRKFSSISTKAGFEGYVAYEYSVGLDLAR